MRNNSASEEAASSQDGHSYTFTSRIYQPLHDVKGTNGRGDLSSAYSSSSEEENDEIVFIVDGCSVKQHKDGSDRATPIHESSKVQIPSLEESTSHSTQSLSQKYSPRNAILFLALAMAVLMGIMTTVVMTVNDHSMQKTSIYDARSNVGGHKNMDESSPISSRVKKEPISENFVSYESQSIDSSPKVGPAVVHSAISVSNTSLTEDESIIVAGERTTETSETSTIIALPIEQTSNSAENVSTSGSTDSNSKPSHVRHLRLVLPPTEWKDSWIRPLTRLVEVLEDTIDRFEQGWSEGEENRKRMKPRTEEAPMKNENETREVDSED
jgi:hypothetical protein